MLGFVEFVSWTLMVAITAVFVGTVWWARAQRTEAVRRLAEATGLFDGVTVDNLYASRGLISQRADALPDAVGSAWREFNESLVSDDAAGRLWNTVEAEQFFSDRRFAPRLIGNRLLDAVPTFLTTLGLIGTFAGLALGLGSISLDGSTDEMTRGIAHLVAGAEVGFRASLLGVVASLAGNVVIRRLERDVVTRALTLQHRIDALFELRSPEQSLTTIASATKDSAAALAQLHEKIGAKLQETIGTAIEGLVSTAGNQSAAVFEQIADRLTESFHDLSTRVASELTAAAQGMTSTLDYMGERLARQADQYAEQMGRLQEATARQIELLETRLPAVVESLDGASARMDSAGTGLAEVTTQLTSTAAWFEETSGRFNETLRASVEISDRLAERHDEASTALATLAARMIDLTTATSEAADELHQSAATLQSGFTTMREHQARFLEDLAERLTRQSEAMSTWLSDYSAEVTAQTATRMGEWNEHTDRFTSSMIVAVQGLNSAVDELETRLALVRRNATEADAA